MNPPNVFEKGETPRSSSLERALAQHEHEITLLAEPGKPLTPDRIALVAPRLLEVIDEAETENVGWPDETSMVPVRPDTHLASYIAASPVEADALFVSEVMAGEEITNGPRGYNNFPAILRSLPSRPAPGESMADFMGNNPSAALYGSKPYLWRAYMLNYDFMSALQEAVLHSGGSAGWGASVVRGSEHPEAFPHDAALLRASRLGYKLLANLMRDDDSQRQYEWLGIDDAAARPITDPEVELWT